MKFSYFKFNFKKKKLFWIFLCQIFNKKNMKYEERSEELLTSMAITSLQSSSLYPSHSNPFESEFKKSKINEIILKESKVEYASSHFDERLDMFTYSVPPDHIDPDEIPPSILINDFG